MEAFARALRQIPATIADNAGLDSAGTRGKRQLLLMSSWCIVAVAVSAETLPVLTCRRAWWPSAVCEFSSHCFAQQAASGCPRAHDQSLSAQDCTQLGKGNSLCCLFAGCDVLQTLCLRCGQHTAQTPQARAWALM